MTTTPKTTDELIDPVAVLAEVSRVLAGSLD